MYEELIMRLMEDKSWIEQGTTETEHEIADHLQKAADAIEDLCAKATPKHVCFSSWKGYRNTRYKCPYCNKNVRNDEAYCHKCGQALMFPRISFTPYVQGETQEVIIEWPDEPPKEET